MHRGDHRRALGRLGEDAAAAHLERLGLTVVARNFRTRSGEIDLVARGAGVVVFVEVKTRLATAGTHVGASAEQLQPLASLRGRQRARVRRAAVAWLRAQPRRAPAASVRFDAIGVVVERNGRLVRIEHLEAAW